MEVQYSNREIDSMLQGIHDKLDIIVEQTTEHNHRMTKVEEEVAERRGFFRAISWTLGIIIPIVISVCGWALWEIIHLPDTVISIVESRDLKIIDDK